MGHMTDPKFDVIIPTKNSARTLQDCLVSLRKSDVPINKIFVVDKYSKDGTIEIARRLSAKVIQSPANCDEAKRYGASIATTSHILILDSDVMINPSFYSKLKPYVRNHFITKGATRYDLNWRNLSDWLFKTGYLNEALEAAFIDRKRFLALTKDWDERHLDAGGDLLLYRTCKDRHIPVAQLSDLVNVHVTKHFSDLWKQASWYGRSDKTSGIWPRWLAVWCFIKSPVAGLNALYRTKDFRLLPYEITYWFYYLLGWLRA